MWIMCMCAEDMRAVESVCGLCVVGGCHVCRALAGCADGAPPSGQEVILGFLPTSLVNNLMDAEGRWRPSALAVEELYGVIKGVKDPGVLQAKLEQVLRMLAGLLKDPQFRVVMALLKTVEVRASCTWLVAARGPFCSVIDFACV
jgi:hypothetical protein